jgi:hypothetical protein
MVAADASPFAENDLMDPDHVPTSLVDSAVSLAGRVATWPLTRAGIRLPAFLTGPDDSAPEPSGD